jgi:Ca2+-transporting ATPase
MIRPPRPPEEQIVTRAGWARIGVLGALITGASLATFVLALNDPALSEGQAVSVAFLTLALAQVWNVFNLRRPGEPILINHITRNPYVWAAISICLALIAAALWVPSLSELMQLPPPSPGGLLLAAGGSIAPVILWPVGRSLAHALIRTHPAPPST